MKLLLYILLSNYLFALCTQKETLMSDKYQLQASKEQTLISQLALLDKALQSCYSPEIEATKQLIQADATPNIKEKILFYNQALISISEFEDRELIRQEQNKINAIVDTLNQKLGNQELAKIIKSKHIDENRPKEPRSFLWVIILFGVLSIWTIFNIFRGYTRKV